MSTEDFAFELAGKITSLLSEYGIRVPEDIEAEIGELLLEKF